MKSLNEIAPKIVRREPQTAKLATISDNAIDIVNEVFKSLKSTFSAFRIAYADETEVRRAKMTWTKTFVEQKIYRIEQVQRGMKKAREQTTDFVPSPGKFVSWCKLSAEDIGLSVDSVSTEISKYQNRMSNETVEFSHWIIEEINIKHGFSLKRANAQLREKIITSELAKWLEHIESGGGKPAQMARIGLDSTTQQSYAESIGYEPSSFEAKALMDRINRNKRGNHHVA